MSDEKTDSIEPRTGEPSLSRRRVLKGAVATAPLIATLPSGAALARSSNLIGQTSGSGQDSLGRTLCLDRSYGSYSDGVVDLGTPPRGRLTAIKDRNYYDSKNWSDRISAKQMCKEGGEFHYWNSGWRTVKVPRGIVVSATALSSFAGSIYTTEV